MIAGEARSPGMAGRALLALVFAVGLVVLAGYYIRATAGLAQLDRVAAANLLGTIETPRRGAALAETSALAADPLAQQKVSGVLSLRALSGVDRARIMEETRILRQLGWRSTTALQNLLWRAGTVADLPLMMDTLDALLRRERMLAQIYPILNLMTLEPEFRVLLTQRLAGRPPWRRYYFLSASDLSKPEEIEGRFLVMRAIQRAGDRLSRNEVAPILSKLVGIGRGAQAFELWQTNQKGAVTAPLADTDFAAVSKPMPGDALPSPFEWQLGSGAGYFADANRDDRGSFASIDWNGRGTPVLLSQVTSAPAGRYRIDVKTDAAPADLARQIGFQLTCPRGDTVTFAPSRRGADTLQLVGRTAVPCAFSTLQLVGLVQPSTTGASIALRSIRLQRIGND